ncbi:homing endonuclease associated repeat-containing protein, partial [Desulfatitalea alkaliphila]
CHKDTFPMKFELTESGNQFSNSELTQDLIRVATLLNKKSVTLKEYQEYGNYSYQTQKKRFGSWFKALETAGLEESKRPWGGDLSEIRIPEIQLIEDIQRVAKKLGKNAITIAEYEDHGKYGSSAISKRFGGWNKAKVVAGLEIGRLYNSTDEDYFENILHVWQTLGRQPKYQEMVAPLSRLNVSSYERKFGSWRSALVRFIEYVNKKDDEATIEPNILNETIKIPFVHDIPSKNLKPKKRTNRTANLRQRFRVMKRDDFRCVLCGSSPANKPGCELHIDHILPWSQGGETVEENLRTLCSDCNLGRSNKE